MAGIKQLFEGGLNPPFGFNVFWAEDDGAGDSGGGDATGAEDVATGAEDVATGDSSGNEGENDTATGDSGAGEGEDSNDGGAAESADSAMAPSSDDSAGDDSSDGEEGKSSDGDEPAVESYEDFVLPEGVEQLDETALAQAAPVMLELGLNQAQAQGIVNLYAQMQQNAIDGIETKRSADKEALVADPDLGNGDEDAYKAAMAQCGRVFNLEGGKEALAKLRAYGLDNDPDIVKMFHRVGGHFSEDSIFSGNGGSGVEADPLAAMFPTTAGQ